jgi:hypothetical protein
MTSSSNKFTDYMIMIDYTKREVDHSGYCSDAGSDTGEEEKYIHRFKVTNKLLNALMSHDKQLIEEDGVINFELIPSFERISKDDIFYDINKFNIYGFPCDIGSGYCGYTGYSTINSVTLYKPLKFNVSNSPQIIPSGNPQ